MYENYQTDQSVWDCLANFTSDSDLYKKILRFVPQWQQVLKLLGMMSLKVAYYMPNVVFPSNSFL
jgi:hypothetical protein